MSVVVGLDLHHKCSGALRFATWLTAPERPRCVHVVLEGYVRHASAFAALPDIMAQEERAAAQAVAEVQGGPGVRVDVKRSEDVSDGLMQALEPGDILVVGRNEGRTSRALVRLGSVTRRVLRKTVVPTFVVPPDLELVGAGPILLATNADPQSNSALRLARELCARRERPLGVVYGLTLPQQRPGYATEALAAATQAVRRRARERLDCWAAEHDVPLHDVQMVEGADAIDEVLALAERSDAALLVTAPYRKGPVQRFVGSSFSMELARHARCPVALVG
jgi:nucleotide-binding universal stress UspA family protein